MEGCRGGLIDRAGRRGYRTNISVISYLVAWRDGRCKHSSFRMCVGSVQTCGQALIVG